MLYIAVHASRYRAPRYWSGLQDLGPDNLAPALILITYVQVVIQVLLAVEPNDPGVVVPEPVLRVDTD